MYTRHISLISHEALNTVYVSCLEAKYFNIFFPMLYNNNVKDADSWCLSHILCIIVRNSCMFLCKLLSYLLCYYVSLRRSGWLLLITCRSVGPSAVLIFFYRMITKVCLDLQFSNSTDRAVDHDQKLIPIFFQIKCKGEYDI
mgnify:CR=1 FL=1